MIHMLLIIFSVLSCADVAYGSQIVVGVKVGATFNYLQYCNKEYVDFINDEFAMKCSYNEPFFDAFGYDKKVESIRLNETLLLNQKIFKVKYLPFKFFLDNADPSKFKQQKEELFSILKDGCLFRFNLGLFAVDVSQDNPQILLNRFRKKARYQEGALAQLLEDKIIKIKNGEFIHSDEGYFATLDRSSFPDYVKNLFAQINDVNNIDITVQFPSFMGDCSRSVRAEQCAVFGIRSDDNDLFVPILEISDFTINNTIDVAWGTNPYSLIGQEIQRYSKEPFQKLVHVYDKGKKQDLDIQGFESQNKALIEWIQKAAVSFKVIPFIFLKNQLNNASEKETRKIHQALVKADLQTFNITLHMSKDGLEKACSWLTKNQLTQAEETELKVNDFEFEEDIIPNKSISFFSYLKKPFFCFVGLAAIWVLYKKLKAY